MGQPQTKGLGRQRALAARNTLLADPKLADRPVLSWPWKDLWSVKAIGSTVIMRNRLELAGQECGPVPLVVKLTGGKSETNVVREATVGRVIRQLVAMDALVNTVAPLFVSGSPLADKPQPNIARVLVGVGKPVPAAVQKALTTAGIGKEGAVTISLAPVANCPPPGSPGGAKPAEAMALMEQKLQQLVPDYKSCSSLFDLLAAADRACSQSKLDNELSTYVAIVLKSIIAQLALAYATINQAGVQHLDGHFNNQLISFTGAFDIEAALSADHKVRVPVRGVFLQVFDWDWSVKWPVPVNDSILNTGRFVNSDRVLPLKTKDDRGFVFDHARRVGNADYGRVVLMLAGQFPALYEICHRYGVAGAAFGPEAARAAASPDVAISFSSNNGTKPYEHGFLVIGDVSHDSQPCTDGHRIRDAISGLWALCRHTLKGEPAAPGATYAVSLPFALSKNTGELLLSDAPGLDPCPLFPQAAGAGGSKTPKPAATRKSPRQRTAKKRPREEAEALQSQSPSPRGPAQKVRRVVRNVTGWLRRKVYG